jgi:hypothetical protein
VIDPETPMVVIAVTVPGTWREGLEHQLAFTPAVWHYACAPVVVRRYAPAIIEDGGRL